MATYGDLKAWQFAHQLVLETYRLTRQFPRDELFGLRAQARRAAFSVAANIVEGHAKRGKAEFRRFMDIAIGSLAELSYAILLARDLEYISVAEWKAFTDRHTEVSKVIWGLYRSLMDGRAR